MIQSLLSLSDWLATPHPRVTDLEKIQRSRLLSTILLVQMLVISFIIILVVYADPVDIREPTVQGAILMVGLSVVMYIANRLGYTSIAALGYFLLFVAIFIYIPFYSGENPAFLAFLIIPLIFIAIFFSIKRTILVSVGVLALVAILLSFMDHSTTNLRYWNLRNMWYFLMLATGLILTFMRHLGNLEEIRRRELKRINEQLEQQVAELERFTYIVSHELKNPVVTIKGYLGSVEKDLQEKNFERAQKDLLRISNASDKLHDTISDLLELSRIRHIVNSPEDVDLTKLIHEMVEMLDGHIRSKNVSMVISSNLPTLYGDRLRLREVFENLIANAIKYMGDQPTPRIEIGIRNTENEQIIFVRDNGIGIEERYQTRIFALFEKLNPTIEGTGIGLALVKRIIEVHGGRVWVESDGLGKGSTFCFTIPASSQTQAFQQSKQPD